MTGTRHAEVVFATDLDRTLIYSAAAAGLGREEGEEDVAAADPLAGAVGVEVYDGRTISYVSPGFADLFATVRTACTVVPVTTRTRAQYERITLFGGTAPEWAVVANGGVLLRRGEPDERWAAEVRSSMEATTDADLDAVVTWLAAEAGAYIDHVRVADGFFAYTIVDRSAMPADAADELSAWLSPRGWRLSVQGRKLYAVPSAVTKSASVRALADRLGARLVIAAGDSLLDRDLLEAADIAIRPCHGELHEAGHDTAVVTSIGGILAAEEILTAVLGALPGAGDPPGRSPGGPDVAVRGSDGRRSAPTG